MFCICGNKLEFKIYPYQCECSECGRKWGRTSAGNLSQASRPTKHALDWRYEKNNKSGARDEKDQ